MILEGYTMAKRNRFLKFERKMTQVLLADAAVFVLYLIFAGVGSVPLKVITAIVAILASLLCLAYLFMCGEIRKKRSLWMTAASAGVLLCTIVSLICNFPSPAGK